VKSEEVVTQTTATSTAMLSALRQSGNGQVWQQFCKRYRPLIVSFARSSFSLNEADAEDAAQDALAAFHVAYCRGDYDRDRGRLRKWLFGIAANHARALLRKKYSSRQVHSTDSAGLAGLAEVIPDAGNSTARQSRLLSSLPRMGCRSRKWPTVWA
jgi:RNA polymerase sigma factor (sigma-70 family)